MAQVLPVRKRSIVSSAPTDINDSRMGKQKKEGVVTTPSFMLCRYGDYSLTTAVRFSLIRAALPVSLRR